MKRNYILAFVAAALFAIACIISFIGGSPSRGAISLIGAISFLLSGIHYRRRSRNENL